MWQANKHSVAGDDGGISQQVKLSVLNLIKCIFFFKQSLMNKYLKKGFFFVIKCCRPIFLLMAIYVQRLECLKSSNILLFFIACCHIGGGTGRFVFLAHKTNKLSFACALIFLNCHQPVWVQQLEWC